LPAVPHTVSSSRTTSSYCWSSLRDSKYWPYEEECDYDYPTSHSRNRENVPWWIGKALGTPATVDDDSLLSLSDDESYNHELQRYRPFSPLHGSSLQTPIVMAHDQYDNHVAALSHLHDHFLSPLDSCISQSPPPLHPRVLFPASMVVRRQLESDSTPDRTRIFRPRSVMLPWSSGLQLRHDSRRRRGTPQEEREQALRDYKVTIEYKHLKSHAPGGVYLVPSLQSLREFYGIIFVRRGPYTNGIFKFRLSLPPKYNDVNQHPVIVFSSPHVYNPYVNYETGQLDLRAVYEKWDPTRHYLVTVLTFLKKIFYAKHFEDLQQPANPQAKELAVSNKELYQEKIEECVRESQRLVFQNSDGPTSTARFTEEELSHRVLRDLLKQNVPDPAQVSQNAILSMIDKASKV
jgi:ubiquitin-protein ligase